MKYLFPLLILLLAACAIRPPYVVSVENSAGGRCTGFAIDNHHVVTAAHCQGLDYVVVEDRVLAAREVATWVDTDLGLYATDSPLGLTVFARPGVADPLRPGISYGGCPLHTAPSQVVYLGDTPICSAWWLPDSIACSGGSGSPVEQGGRVVAMMVAVFTRESDDRIKTSNVMCVVPSGMIQRRLPGWE